MEKQKKSYGKTALIVLLLIITIASLVLATYAWAKYSSVTEGSANAQVAKWNVTVDFTSKDFEEKYEHVLAQRLAPGMKGKFDITVKSNDTEVDFDYEIIFLGTTAEYVNDSDKNGSNSENAKAPAHLHFYTDENSHDTNHEINVSLETQTNETAKSYLKGSLNKKDSSNGETKTEETKTIYWEWPYEDPNKESTGSQTDSQSIQNGKLQSNGGDGISDYDNQDTIDGMHPVKVTVKFKVVATQKNPTEK